MARPFFVPPTDEDIIEYYRILDQLLSDLMDILNVIFRGRRRLSEPTIRRAGRWPGHPARLPDVVADAVRAAHRQPRLSRTVVHSVDKLSSCYYDVSLQLHLIAETFRCRLQQEAEKAGEPSPVVSGGGGGGEGVGGGVGVGVGVGVGGASLLARLVPPQYGRPVCWTVIALYVGWRIICSR